MSSHRITQFPPVACLPASRSLSLCLMVLSLIDWIVLEYRSVYSHSHLRLQSAVWCRAFTMCITILSVGTCVFLWWSAGRDHFLLRKSVHCKPFQHLSPFVRAPLLLVCAVYHVADDDVTDCLVPEKYDPGEPFTFTTLTDPNLKTKKPVFSWLQGMLLIVIHLFIDVYFTLCRFQGFQHWM